MKIAYITTGNLYMNTSANIRNLALIKGLEQLGHEVRVVCFENRKPIDPEFVECLKDTDIHCIGKVETSNSEGSGQAGVSLKGKIISKIKKVIHPLYKKVQVYDPYKHNISEIDSKILNWNEYDIVISSSDPPIFR